jgi:glycosyltransferase involved in cell wall biosynthesis
MLKRITHIISTIELGGAEKQLLVLTKEQIAIGMNVDVIYLKGKPTLKDEFESLGVNVINSFANKNFIRQIAQLMIISRTKLEKFHAHLPQAELLAMFAIPRGNFVVSRHIAAQFAPRLPRYLSRKFSQLVTSRASGVIAISQAVADYLSRSNEVANTCKVYVVLYGAENMKSLHKTKAGSVRESLNISDNSYLVGTIARIVEQKDFPTLLNAFKYLTKVNPDSELIILGEGNLLPQMQRLAIELNMGQKVHWLGKHSDVVSYLNAMDTFILTSKYEGFGLVLLEALQSSVPIVASNVTSIPEVLGSNYPHLCGVGDVQAFGENLFQLSKQEFREVAVSHLMARQAIFSPLTMCQNVSNVYFEIFKDSETKPRTIKPNSKLE